MNKRTARSRERSESVARQQRERVQGGRGGIVMIAIVIRRERGTMGFGGRRAALEHRKEVGVDQGRMMI